MSSDPAAPASSHADPASALVEKTEEPLWRRPPEADLPQLIDLYSGSLENWDEEWEGDIPDDETLLQQMGIEVDIIRRWWGFELHCNEQAVRYIERIRRTIARVVSRFLPPPIPRLVAIYLRVRAIVIRLMLRRGNGLRFLSPWTAPLLLSPRPRPPAGESDLPAVNDEKMRWSVFDPRNAIAWSDPELLPSQYSAASPAMAGHQGKLYCVYRGATGDFSLYSSTYTSEEGWSEAERLPLIAHRSEVGPALVEYRGVLHGFYIQQGTQRLVWMRFMNGRWQQPHFEFSEIINTQSSPSVVATNDRMYCFFENGGRLQYLVFHGDNFTVRQMVPIFDAASSPAAVVSGNRIVCVWASRSNANLFGSSFDPRNNGVWSDSNGIRFSGQHSNVKPALVIHENTVYCVHSGLDQRLYWGTVSPQGAPLTTPVVFPAGHESFAEPGLTVFQDTNMLGHGDSQLMAVYRGIRR